MSQAFRCQRCDKLKTKGWGDMCNQCLDEDQKHYEVVDIQKKQAERIAELEAERDRLRELVREVSEANIEFYMTHEMLVWLQTWLTRAREELECVRNTVIDKALDEALNSSKEDVQIILSQPQYEKLCSERDALKEILEDKQRIIAVMDHDLLNLGVNFDFDAVFERWKELNA